MVAALLLLLELRFLQLPTTTILHEALIHDLALDHPYAEIALPEPTAMPYTRNDQTWRPYFWVCCNVAVYRYTYEYKYKYIDKYKYKLNR